MPRAPRTPALAYLRTSSATNVGVGKDSEKRQRAAIAAYARRTGLEILGEHYDAAVSGADPLDARTGFTNLLAHAELDSVRVILVEAASRFARDLMVQEAGHAMLARAGIMLVAVDDPDCGSVCKSNPAHNYHKRLFRFVFRLSAGVSVGSRL